MSREPEEETTAPERAPVPLEPLRAMRVVSIGRAVARVPGSPADFPEGQSASLEETPVLLSEADLEEASSEPPPVVGSSFDEEAAEPAFLPEEEQEWAEAPASPLPPVQGEPPVSSPRGVPGSPSLGASAVGAPPLPPPSSVQGQTSQSSGSAPVSAAPLPAPAVQGQASSGPVSSERRPPPPARPQLPSVQPRRKPWWEEVFGDDFSRAHRLLPAAQVERECHFIAKMLEINEGSVVLDLCCGQGQHAVELSRCGYSVVGYDLSVYQLAMAADWAQSHKQKINFLQGDMREMAFDSMFDAVISWDTSFGYFEEEKNLDVARRIFSALKPGGSLLLDVINRDYAASEAPSSHWFEGDGCLCMDDMSLDWITSRLKVKRSVILDDGRSKELTYSIRVYNLSEIGKLLHSVGFRVLSVSGHISTPGAFLGPQSPRIIIRAQRPGS